MGGEPPRASLVRAVGPGPEALGLAAEAERQGFAFARRLVRDVLSGRNRFDGPGECWLEAWRSGRVVGFGGLNIDPFIERPHRVGRLRHVYVAADHRRSGIGSILVGALLERANLFERVRLRTDSARAAAFYERTGFAATTEADATHTIALRDESDRTIQGNGEIVSGFASCLAFHAPRRRAASGLA